MNGSLRRQREKRVVRGKKECVVWKGIIPLGGMNERKEINLENKKYEQ